MWRLGCGDRRQRCVLAGLGSTPAPAEPKTSGTFSTSGAVTLSGPLTDVVCSPADDDVQVTARYEAAGTTARLTVHTGPAPDGHERPDGLTVRGAETDIYSRISADFLPFTITRKDSFVAGSVALANMRDIAVADIGKRKRVTMTVAIDCGDSLC